MKILKIICFLLSVLIFYYLFFLVSEIKLFSLFAGFTFACGSEAVLLNIINEK